MVLTNGLRGLLKVFSSNSSPKPEQEGIIEQYFHSVLTEYIPRVGYNPPKNPRILEIGFGMSPVGKPLVRYFGNNGEYIGIDINRKQEVEDARKNHNFNDATYLEGNATELSDYVSGEFDVVVTRNPEVVASTSDWAKIYEEVKKVLKDDGILIGTSYKDEEQTMRGLLENAGYQIILDGPNQLKLHPLWSSDTHILIVRINSTKIN